MTVYERIKKMSVDEMALLLHTIVKEIEQKLTNKLIEAEIDFKKAAKVVGEKSLEMLHLKDLTKVTGYVRGGCTAIGMKKQFPTVIQKDAEVLEYMHVSAGKLGMQLKLSPKDLQKASNAKFDDVIH